MNNRKIISIIVLLVLFLGQASAAPLDVEIKKLLGSEVTPAQNVSFAGQGDISEKDRGFLSIGSTSDGVITPGENIEYDQDFTVFGSGDICPVHAWVEIDGEVMNKEGTFYPTCDVNNDYEIDFDAPDQTGTYSAEFYAGYWPDSQFEPDWQSQISSDTFEVENPDSDGDGIPDAEDKCPNESGLESLDGCPNTQPEIVELDVETGFEPGVPVDANVNVNDPDTDQGQSLSIEWSNGDTGSSTTYSYSSAGSYTVSVDVSDGFETVSASETISVENPDSDNDGVADNQDLCSGTPSGVEVDSEGCALDTDNDDLADYEDNCPDVAGPESNSGCPFDDSDGDGVNNPDDKCVETPGSKENGCPTFDESFVQFIGDIIGDESLKNWISGGE